MKRSLLLASGFCTATLLLAGCGKDDPVLARVGDVDIRASAYRRFVERLPARGPRRDQASPFTYVALLFLLSGMVLPLLWTVLTSFKYNVDVTLGWIPPRWTVDNYVGVVEAFSFLRYYLNSLFIACAVTLVQVATSIMAAYAFARLQFRGRDLVFLGYLATMMIPSDVLMIPQFVLMKKIPEWLNMVFGTEAFGGFVYFRHHYVGRPVGLDSFFALIAPGCFSAYGTFMLRQFLLGISHEIEEAAYIDGCSPWGVFRHVILPLAKPALAALAIFTFLGRWRAFLWPLIMIDSDSMMVLSVGLAKLSDLYTNNYGLICAGTVLMLIPMIAVFVLCQRWFISGIQLGSVKG